MLSVWGGGDEGGYTYIPGQVQKGVHGFFVTGDALQSQTVGVQAPSPHTGFDDESQGHPDTGGDQSGHQKVGDSDAPQFAQGAGVQAGSPGDEAADHQRQDDHLQHPQQHLSGEGEVSHLRLGQVHVPDQHAQPDAHQHAGHGHDDQQVLLQAVQRLLHAPAPHLLLRALLLLHHVLRGRRGGCGVGHGVSVDLTGFLHV